MLLEAPLMLDKRDIYPSRAEPHFLIEPPAPELGSVTSSYVEVAGAGFMCSSALGSKDDGVGATTTAASAVAASQRSGSHLRLAFGPTGGTQGLMLCIGVTIHLSQGALAGATLLQLAIAPWPDASGSLVRPMAFAPMAMQTQRMLHVLASFAFLGAADLHAVVVSYTSGLLLIMYAIVIVTLLLELPTDVALHHGRDQREAILSNALNYAKGVNESSAGNSMPAEVLAAQRFEDAYTPQNLASMQYEPHDSAPRDFFSTALSKQQLDFWTGLLWVRAALATFSWITSTLLQSGWVFAVPPVALDPTYNA